MRRRRVTLPHEWAPYPYQKPSWTYQERRLMRSAREGYRVPGGRSIKVWHRRAGKDHSDWEWMLWASQVRKALYLYLLPTATQARLVIWDAIDESGKRFLDYIPPELIASSHEQEMKVWLRNGSLLRLGGSDNFHRLVGANLGGVVFSEWARANPVSWEYIRPILAKNGGWAAFNSTILGMNHCWDMLQMARKNPDWFGEKVTVDESRDHAGRPVITPEMVEAERAAGMSENLIDQEFYCDETAEIEGAIYGKQMRLMEQQGRIRSAGVEYDPRLPLFTSSDLGRRDFHVTCFWQPTPHEIRLIDCYHATGGQIRDHADAILGRQPEHAHRRGWVYTGHYMPGDVEVEEQIAGKSRMSEFRAEGVWPIRVAPHPSHCSREDGIELTRVGLERVVVNGARCELWVSAMKQYRREWDARLHALRVEPTHDWTSHFADSTRYFFATMKDPARQRPKRGPRRAHARVSIPV